MSISPVIIVGSGINVGFGAYSNLVIEPNITTPASRLDINADSITLAGGSSVYDATSVNLTADITVVGANGRDAGSEAVSTWYGAYSIYNGTTVASLLSTSFTAPTMPSGYTYKRLVGVVRNDGSGNFVNFKQIGDQIQNVARNLVATGLSSLTFVTQSIADQAPTASGRLKSVSFGAIGNAGNGAMALSVDGTNTMAAITFTTGNSAVGETAALGSSNVFGKLLMNGDDLQILVSQFSANLFVTGYGINL